VLPLGSALLSAGAWGQTAPSVGAASVSADRLRTCRPRPSAIGIAVGGAAFGSAAASAAAIAVAVAGAAATSQALRPSGSFRPRGRARRGRRGWQWSPSAIEAQPRVAAAASVGSVAEAPAVEEERPQAASPLTRTEWPTGLAMFPPADVRNRIKSTRAMLGKNILAYIGDTVWEYLVLRHQYMQGAKSPFTESQAGRGFRQAKTAAMLYRSRLLTKTERTTLRWGTANSWQKQVKSNPSAVEQVGLDGYSASRGLCTLLGYLFLDAKSSDERLEDIVREVGLLAGPGEEDRMLEEITEGRFDCSKKPRTTFFLALSPLGNLALRLYVSRYLVQRPPRDEEFIYRVQLALRQDELDLAATAFLREDATPEEVKLMKAAHDQRDTYAFAFECLLGHLSLTSPYRLHQIVANFGWANPLPGT